MDLESGIIQTHQGIKFSADSFGPLDETFLHQIHFAGYDLRGKTVVTGGAYVGDTPLYFSYYGATVYAFEPDPVSFGKANRNILLNPELKERITLKNYAIGKDEEINFPLTRDSGSSGLYTRQGTSTINVQSKSVSSIIDEFSISEPYLLDLDIKGEEFTIVNDPAVSNFKKVRIEYSPYLFKDSNKSPEILIEKLKALGFTKFRLYKHNNLRFDLQSHGTIECEQ